MQYLVLFIVADDDIYLSLSFLEMNDLISNFKSNQIKSDQDQNSKGQNLLLQRH